MMRCSRIFFVFSLLSLSVSLHGQMTPSAPVQDFRFPRFGENGYTQWVLQGEQGIYDSEAQIRVEGMALRLYSGDERMALELSLDSPQATLRLQENRAFSEDAITIVGSNFEITGVGWEWSGETKEIVVKTETVVRFTQAIGSAFSEARTGAEKETEIRSKRLLLRTTEEGYYFEFTEQVEALSGAMDLQAERLIAMADPPRGQDEPDAPMPPTAPTELDALRRIFAEGNVLITQSERTVQADEAEFFPREERALLDGNASVATPGAYLSGQRIRSQSGEIVLSGAEGQGRAQMILMETGGLGLLGKSGLSAETIVLADTIIMREQPGENRFLFEGEVEVMSGALQMRADKMTIVSTPGDVAESAVEVSELQVGEVERIVAEGEVVIEQSGQLATGERVVFYPDAQRAVLTGEPRLTNGDAVVTGIRMELKPGNAIIRGDSASPVKVRLPKLPDLGYDLSASNGETSDVTHGDPEPVETVVTSHVLRMIEEADHTLFRFTDAVLVEATNLSATGERLDVIAREVANPPSGVSNPLQLDRIEAYGGVEITQTGRISTSEKAFILPDEGKLVLEGEAVVDDERGRVSGHRMTLLQGQRRAIVEGGGSGDDGRARITLPALPD
ncbi:MAG: LPS export ABC transporter periplasmic protein LptC [Verrucomicrobia bacterium]|jgi:lipopolysaccharide export system protein LptA|nr:LPS export ABC transporter periplasmic protein LptC [Verrucomicrobiota bacterium]